MRTNILSSRDRQTDIDTDLEQKQSFDLKIDAHSVPDIWSLLGNYEPAITKATYQDGILCFQAFPEGKDGWWPIDFIEELGSYVDFSDMNAWFVAAQNADFDIDEAVNLWQFYNPERRTQKSLRTLEVERYVKARNEIEGFTTLHFSEVVDGLNGEVAA